MPRRLSSQFHREFVRGVEAFARGGGTIVAQPDSSAAVAQDAGLSASHDNSRALKRWLKARAQPERSWLRKAILAGGVNGIGLIVQAGLLAYALHGAIIAGRSLADLSPALAGYLALIVVRALAQRQASLWSMIAAIRVKANLRREVLAHLRRLGPRYTSQHDSGALATLPIEQIEAIEGYVARFLPQTVHAAFLPVAILLVVMPLDWLAGLIFLFTAPLVPLFMALVGMKAAGANREQFQALSRLGGVFLDRLRGLPTLRLFNRATAEAEHLRQASDAYRQGTMRVLRLAFLSSAVLEFFAMISIAVVAIYIGMGLIGLFTLGPAGDITLYSGLFILLLAPEFYQPLRQLGAFYHDRAAAIGAAEALTQLLAEPVEAPRSGRSGTVRVNGIQFDQAAVTYPGGRRGLEPFSLHVSPGERLALTGPSGCGKSTALNLLLGFFPPDQGRISVGGVPLAQIGAEQRRGLFAYLPQRPTILHGTVADNVRFLDDGIDREAVQRALHLARATFVEALPRGIDTVIGERGYGLSGGQIQRIALARAIARQASMLLLDEPTTGLDSDTRKQLLGALDDLPPDQTVLIATHDPAVIAWADRHVEMATSCAM